MYFQLRFRVSSGQVLITTALVFSEVFFNGLMSQDLTGSFSVYGDIGLTYLKVEHIRVPLWIHRARRERLCSLLPFEVGLLHYFTVASDFSSAANTPGRRHKPTTLSSRARRFVLYCCKFQRSECLCSMTECLICDGSRLLVNRAI